jgi:hypothetical protein
VYRRAAYQSGWVEALEGRRLFSAGPVGPVVDSSPPHGPVVSAPKITTPDIVGSFTGTVVDSNEKSPGVFTAVILTQSSSGKLTGYVESTYPGNAPHVTYFTGTISGDVFTMHTPTTVVTGTVWQNGVTLTGSYVFKTSTDSSIGHFVASRAG